MTTEKTLSASDLLRFRKNLFHSYKMIVTNQIEILYEKSKQNEAQYDLGRKAAKISALSSKTSINMNI